MTATESIKHQSSSIRKKNKGVFGFTLIELMVAIAIVAIMAAVGMVMYSTAQKAGRISKRIQDLSALRTAIELYKSSTGNYPNQNVAATCGNSATALGALVPNYMTSLPADPLGGTNCYRYQSDAASNSQEYKIWTYITTSGEMSDTDFERQAAMIDPARDGGSATTCTIEAGTATAWAFYTPGACAY